MAEKDFSEVITVYVGWIPIAGAAKSGERSVCQELKKIENQCAKAYEYRQKNQNRPLLVLYNTDESGYQSSYE